MCGIAGFIGNGTRADLERMVSTITHRGPDDSGIFHEKNVAFGHTRLSILDLSASGHQPMFDVEKKTCLVFNGEIYNFLTLREELRTLGYTFASNSDTEVILLLYKHYKEASFSKLNGMFALGIYDFEQQKLILARDRTGEKPLYWTNTNDTFLFGSELKALNAHSAFEKEIDLQSLKSYLAHQYVPTPNTIYKNVYKLKPGTYVTFKDNLICTHTYWQPDFTEKRVSFSDATTSLDTLMRNSVRDRMIADVPVGIFLSGGLDSSIISYYAKQESANKIQTFSIGFKEAFFDESLYAKQVAKHLNTEHHEKIISASDCLSLIPQLPEVLDEPVSDSSILPTLILSEFTRQTVKVALGGDGGDELFAGYQTFQADIFARWYRHIPLPIRRHVLQKMIDIIPTFGDDFNHIFFLKKFMNGIESNNYHTHQNWMGVFSQNDQEHLFLKKTPCVNLYTHIDNIIMEFPDSDEQNLLLHTYFTSFLMDQVLVKVDRASMYHGLETRAPFLDFDLINFVHTLPYSFKLRGLTTKYILKELMKDKLPKEIIYRNKKGFRIPLGEWLKGDLKDFCDSTLSKATTDQMGLFDYVYIEKLKQQHFSNTRNNSRKLWNLITFYMWYKKWMS